MCTRRPTGAYVGEATSDKIAYTPDEFSLNLNVLPKDNVTQLVFS